MAGLAAGGQWESTRNALEALLASYGLALWDVDRWLAQHDYTKDTELQLHGFTTSWRTGHLNQDGHRVWAAMYHDLITSSLTP